MVPGIDVSVCQTLLYDIAQPKPSPALPSPNPKLGARVCTYMQLLSLSHLISSCTQVSHLLEQLYSNPITYLYTTLHNFTQLYQILPNFTRLYPTSPNFTQLYPTLPNFTQLYLALPKFTQLYPTLPNFNTTLLNFTQHYSTLPNFTQLYPTLPNLTELYPTPFFYSNQFNSPQFR